MQNRYAGDVGDYVKLALLRALSPGRRLGIAWYVYPDEDHNFDGRHISYLAHPRWWRQLDPFVFDTLVALTLTSRSISALEHCFGSASFAGDTISTGYLPAGERSVARSQWFQVVLQRLSGCEIVFADPDNGLVDDRPHRRRQRTFGKQMPISEALALAEGRTAVIYHHNSRFKGGHDAEVDHWLGQLGQRSFAIRATAYSCRTFFILNADREIELRAEAFCHRWSNHKVRLHLPASERIGRAREGVDETQPR